MLLEEQHARRGIRKTSAHEERLGIQNIAVEIVGRDEIGVAVVNSALLRHAPEEERATPVAVQLRAREVQERGMHVVWRHRGCDAVQVAEVMRALLGGS